MLEERLDAVWARLRRIAELGDPAPALEPQAVIEARQLSEHLHSADGSNNLMACYALGWLLYHRTTALPEQEGLGELVTAVHVFTPCFLDGATGLPQPLLPMLVEAVEPHALEVLKQELASREPRRLTFAVDLWQRIVDATPAEDPQRPGRLSNLGLALRLRYLHTRESAEDLDRSATAGREALRSAPPDHSERGVYAVGLQSTLLARFERTADAADLDESAEVGQEALDRARPADPYLVDHHANLGVTLQLRFTHRGDPADLDRAVGLLQYAARRTPADHADRPMRLYSTGATMVLRYERTQEAADLDQAVEHLGAALRAVPPGHPGLPSFQGGLGAALQVRFERTGELTDLDRAVDHLRTATGALPPGHPHRAPFLADLGNAMRLRFERTQSLTDIGEAIGHFEAAVRETPAGHPKYGVYVAGTGTTLVRRSLRTGDAADLDRAVECLRSAARALPPGVREHTACLNDLGDALRMRFERTGDRADLDGAVGHLRAATVASAAVGGLHIAAHTNLGAVLHARFEAAGDVADLDGAIEHFETAARLLPSEHHNRAGCMIGLGRSLRARFRETGDLADLDRAIDSLRDATRVVPAGHHQQAHSLALQVDTLRLRFQWNGDPAELDDAISAAQESVRRTPADHPNRPSFLSTLGDGLQLRFEWGGDPAELDDAISAAREAVRLTPEDHRDRGARRSTLGTALQRRFRRTGDLTDLGQAIDHLEAAARATSAGHPEGAVGLANLGNALYTRFERTHDLADLDRAVEHLEAAVRAAPAPSDPGNRAAYLTSLGVVLQARFERTGDAADIDRAIRVGEEAVRVAPPSATQRAGLLSNLGKSHWLRFDRADDPADLDATVGHMRAAAHSVPPGHPDRANYLSNLGSALGTRYERARDAADKDAAAAAFDAARQVAAAAPAKRVQAAMLLSRVVADSEPDRAADAAEAAVRLLPEVSLRQLGRGDRQHAIGRFPGLAGEAASLALADPRGTRHERATRALRLLEAGRTVLIGQALDDRSDLTALERHSPELAARFIRLRDRLDTEGIGTTDSLTAEREPAGDQEREQDRHHLARDFARTVADIRDLDSFATFALPPTTEELLAQAEHGPVAVFAISRHRSDALLLTRDGISQLALPRLTAEELIERIDTFSEALYTTVTSTDRAERRAAQADMTGVLEWLWDTAAGPVLDALGHHRQPGPDAEWPRMWWAPGGLLGLLPVHAAGYHTDAADDPYRRTVLDRVVSSYTPSVRALRHARQRTWEREQASAAGASRGLIVAMPTTPGLPEDGRLAHVGAEAAMLRRHLPDAVLLAEPEPDEPGTGPAPTEPNNSTTPTKAAVLSHLPAAPIAHFACHGASHPTDPSQSLLVLHDHESDPFTVGDLAPVRLDRAELAYLSACETAAIDTTELIDEAIHLTSAFQLAGFSHVVGTLWEIADRTAVTVADTFYTQLRTPSGALRTDRAAWALHQAVRGNRDGHDLPDGLDRTRTPFLWAGYLHAGA
ncbi:CHAT domain-containing protein [Streptomyces sp. OV198]|uniref:CHAT domain-containing tetratricopeptide repeat protein n=1 Tax=Streptomyces sp. OV198 TaxID=1882787 RepID=UPI000BC3C850|nr:CHAT domain-containing protein [Streptomyces sp. OV198]SOE47231.1 CHAT domain-containing protein [Streptomyces sp. OV198]